MSQKKFCFKLFYYYEETIQKRITPDTKMSEIKQWFINKKGLSESCTFYFDEFELGNLDCTINDIVNGDFEKINNITIKIKDLEWEKTQELKRKEQLEKEKEEKEKMKKEKEFNRDIHGTYCLEQTKNNMLIQKYPDNPFNNSEEKNCKTIMVIGQTGTGKTTLLNSLINYILGIKLTDKKRFKIIQEYASSQVESVTSITSIHYIRSHNNHPYIKIIDTPGLGDTKGVKADLEISNQITKLLCEEINQLDRICFVIKNYDARLTVNQKYIFNSVIDLFSKDMMKKFFIMLTFTDASKKTPIILDSLESEDSGLKNIILNVEKPYYLQFNCSAIFNDNTNDKFTELYWKICEDSLKAFMQKLNNSKPQKLEQTRKLLHNIQRRDILIESCIYNHIKLYKLYIQNYLNVKNI